ncbi:MAG: bifunctional demethylmenaquinone methyltransferase/2-methoxy-6-polyprenyl-1,4-benzoquinol methylase UbiE [Actinomycetaceae bacterium]|nr:bifunctional demethylmenaquinone methyltransferase/2-methoxy-6-polyprenyl-1,4-benzoquinol methylase UbiE [Actinomycetaceae bacterium]
MEVRANLSKEAEDVAQMFDEVSSRYDITNTVLTFGQVFMWRAAVTRAIGVRPGMKILDLACGTGASTASFAKAGADVIGCDFSEGMIREGLRRRPHLNLIQGDAMDLPFEDESFDVVTMSYGLRNVQDPMKALEEMYRVVRPGGKLVISEFSTPVSQPMNFLYRFYITRVLPAISKVVSSDGAAYEYLHESILDWPDKNELGFMIKEAGWSDVQWRSLSFGTVAIHRAVRL